MIKPERLIDPEEEMRIQRRGMGQFQSEKQRTKTKTKSKSQVNKMRDDALKLLIVDGDIPAYVKEIKKLKSEGVITDKQFINDLKKIQLYDWPFDEAALIKSLEGPEPTEEQAELLKALEEPTKEKPRPPPLPKKFPKELEPPQVPKFPKELHNIEPIQPPSKTPIQAPPGGPSGPIPLKKREQAPPGGPSGPPPPPKQRVQAPPGGPSGPPPPPKKLVQAPPGGPSGPPPPPRKSDSVRELLKKENELTRGTEAKPKKETQSDLQHQFTSYDKSKPKEDKPKTNIPYATMPKQLTRQLRDYLRDNFNLVPDYDETEFVMDNFVDDETKQRLLENDVRAGNKIAEIIQTARETYRFVPEDIEGNENMTKEERQILFHKLMIESKSVREAAMKPKTNFDNYDKMGGGINAGLETKSKKDEESVPIKLPDEFKDYEFLLDSKIKDNAEARELMKGIDPNAIIDSNNEELMNAYFAKMNELSNEQDNREINEAVENIEILSGGNKDSLFGATDLLTTRGNLNVRFNQDLPDNIPDNPAPIERGRDAQAIPEVDIEAIERENRADYATTIASGIGVLGNAYRGIFGQNDIMASRGQNNILEDINQNIRLIGKRGIYGDDKSLKVDDDMYEGTTLDKRLSSLREFKNQRILGEKNPQTLEQHAQATEQDDALRQAMMFNRGAGGAQGATLQQLREQEFAYKQANRGVTHDGRQFIRGGRATQIKIEQEYDP